MNESPLQYFNRLMNQDEDKESMNDSISNTLPDAEYREFRAWRDERIRTEARREAQAEASKVNLEAEAAADRAAIAALEARGITDLAECFGGTSTLRGRNAITLIHQAGIGIGHKHYPRLRRMAVERGLAR